MPLLASIEQDFAPRAIRAPMQWIRPWDQNSECPRFIENQMTLPSPCLGDLVKFLTPIPWHLPSHPGSPIAPQTSQRHRECPPQFVPSLRTQIPTHEAPSVLIWPCPATHLVSSPVLPLFLIFFYFSLFCLFCFVYLLEGLNLCSQ